MNSEDEINKIEARCNRALAEIAQISGWERQLVSWLQRQISEHANACRKLRKWSGFGYQARVSNLQSRILSSFPARLCGKLYETKYGKHANKTLSPIEWGEFERQINLVPLKCASADPCRVYAVHKKNGTTRWLNVPGQRTKEAQRVLANVLMARLPLNESEFNQKGKGRDAAVTEIVRQIREENISTFIVFDLANFFSSVRPKHLQWLNLPAHVLNQAVFFNHKTVQYVQKGLLGKTEPARLGLPQGAMASGHFASALLRRELRYLDGVVGKVTYVDDGVIGASSPVQAQRIAQALKKRFANLEGGPISFKKIDIHDIAAGLEFLGYWIKADMADPSSLIIVPSHSAKMKFRAKLFRRLNDYKPALDYETAVDIFKSMFENWRRSFSHWKPDEDQLQYTEYEALCWLDDLNIGKT